MRHQLSLLARPTALLYIFHALTQIADGIYLASGFEPNDFFTTLRPLGFLWIIGWWMRRDSERTGVKWVFDMGLFLSMLWPILVPYYLIKTRGAKGLLPISAFAGVAIVATLLGVLIWQLFAPAGYATD